jgi:hypothetical protein
MMALKQGNQMNHRNRSTQATVTEVCTNGKDRQKKQGQKDLSIGSNLLEYQERNMIRAGPGLKIGPTDYRICISPQTCTQLSTKQKKMLLRLGITKRLQESELGQ